MKKTRIHLLQKSRLVYLLFFLLLTWLITPSAPATEEYAAKTNLDCQACHLSSSGGGELTSFGKGFQAAGQPDAHDGQKKKTTKSAGTGRIFHLLIGYLHIVTGIFWFGTILYVHLILKPGYASRGLPRGEVRLGLVSMLVMAITGSILTWYRVPSLEFFITTKFGILLLAKILLFLVMTISALFVVLYIGPKLKKKIISQVDLSQSKFTVADLAQFDGKEGRPAYVAFKGNIYNVSDSKIWKAGVHVMRHHAGTDLTKFISQAPHTEEKILAMPMVGSFNTDLSGQNKKSWAPARVFYFMAYMNLINVLLISLILALWRW